MLQEAGLYRTEIENFMRNMANREYLKYYFANGYAEFTHRDNKDEWMAVCRVSLNPGDNSVIGWFRADLHRHVCIVKSMEIVNMTRKPNPIFARDLFRFMGELFTDYQCRKIHWTVARNNPAKRQYDKAIKLIGGRVIGFFQEEFLLVDGSWEDAFLYEICAENYLKSSIST